MKVRDMLGFLSLFLLACGSGTSPTLDADERESFDRGAEAHLALQNAVALADSAFDFDPTIDTSKSAAENATAVQAHLAAQQPGCGSVVLQGSTVTATFPSSGCTFGNGVVVAGTFMVGVSKVGSSVTLALTFTQVTVNGTDLSGTASFATSNGTTFSVTSNLSSKGNTVVAMLTVTGAAAAVTVDGTATVTKGAATTNLTFSKVSWKKGDCYPSSGTLKVGRAAFNQTMTFTSTSASTGQVTVTTGRVSSTVTLPAYGSCPH